MNWINWLGDEDEPTDRELLITLHEDAIEYAKLRFAQGIDSMEQLLDVLDTSLPRLDKLYAS